MPPLYISRKSALRAARKTKMRCFTIQYQKRRNADCSVDQGFVIVNRGR